MAEPFFTDVTEPIRFAGLGSTDPLTFKVYDRDRLVLGKRMEDHLRPGVCFWHSFAWPGTDMFGIGTLDRPWLRRDGRPDGRRPREDGRRLRVLHQARRARTTASTTATSRPRARPSRSSAPTSTPSPTRPPATRSGPASGCCGARPTCSRIPRYQAGAATNPDPEVFAYAAAQVKHMLEVTQRLGGANYVLWGGREGYDTLLNTDLRREGEQLARFLHLVAGAQAQDRLPGHAAHRAQADGADQAPVRLRHRDRARLPGPHGLEGEYRVNIEANHATLAGPQLPPRGRVRDRERDARAASTPTAAIRRTAGTPTSSRTRSRTWSCRSTRSCGAAASRPAASTSTPSCVARASTGTTCSTPTSAASTRSPGPCSWPRPSSRTASWPRCEDARYAGWDGALGAAILDGSLSLADLEARVADGEIDPAPRVGAPGAAREPRQPARSGPRTADPDGPRHRDRHVDDRHQGRPHRRGRPGRSAIGVAEYDYEVPQPLWSEQDPPLWWDGTVSAIRSVLASTGVDGADVAAIGLTGPDARPRPARRRRRGAAAGDPLERPADRRTRATRSARPSARSGSSPSPATTP